MTLLRSVEKNREIINTESKKVAIIFPFCFLTIKKKKKIIKGLIVSIKAIFFIIYLKSRQKCR